MLFQTMQDFECKGLQVASMEFAIKTKKGSSERK